MPASMIPLAVGRWVVARLIRHPVTWVWLVLLSAVWPIVASLAPIGLATSRATEAEAVYEIAFLGALVAATTAQAILGRGNALLVPLSRPRRLAVELSAHLAAAALFLVPALALAALVGAPRDTFAPARLPLGALQSVLHLAVLALVLDRLRLPGPVALAGLPLVAWLLPAILPHGAGFPLDLFRSAFDAGLPLSLSGERAAGAAHRMGAWLPIIGWALVASLVEPPSHHALRDPR